ncbi:hypothetical protein [Paenibacillus qinlingensis]|uniref:Uncharacterized protein n=1 Tax=Paenibacillus qinlingensis TaxID=1837343 RepID=A0ABU1P6Q8_9BACL|nr:hypothetical protein [Paenibacillus qinlingensis]MDR6555435.1 hypothetical protein [Paenibacillus qinlingensis]
MLIVNQSAFDVFTATPSNTTTFAQPARGFYIGDGAVQDVAIRTQGGQDVTLVSLEPGIIHWFACKQIRATGTSATDIKIVY